MKRVLLSTLFISSVLASSVSAAPAPKKKLENPSPWTGNVQFGYSGTGGNTQDNNVSGKFNLLYQKNKWTNSLKTDALFSNNSQDTTAERYSGTLELNYNFKKRLFSFYRNNTVYDKFNAFDLTISNALGLGMRVLDAKKVTIDLQAGPGYRDARIAGTNKHENGITGFAAGTLNWALSKTANLQQTLNVDAGSDNTITKAQTSLTADIVGNLGLQTSFLVTHNSEIPEGSSKTKKTDYQTDVTLLFSF